MKTLSTIHLLLAQVRKERGIAQSAIADLLKLDQTAISLYENGHRGIPLPTLERWCEALDIKVEITPQGYEPAKEPDYEKRDLEEWGRLKRRRNYLIAEMRSLMAVEAMRTPELQAVDEESGEGQFWPYAIHGDHAIGLVQTRYDHPSQRFLAVEYTGEEVNVYRFRPESAASGGPGRAYFTEDDFLTLIGSASYEEIEALKSTVFRERAGRPDDVELVNPEGFPIKSLWEMQESHARFAAVHDAVIGREDYLEMEEELLQIESRLDELLADNRLGNGMPNPAFQVWNDADVEAVSVPLHEAERTWHWVEEGVSWVDDFGGEATLRLWVDPAVHEGYETLSDGDGSRVIGAVGPEMAPAVFKRNPAKGMLYRVEVSPDELTEEETERHRQMVESASELRDMKETE